MGNFPLWPMTIVLMGFSGRAAATAWGVPAAFVVVGAFGFIAMIAYAVLEELARLRTAIAERRGSTDEQNKLS